MTSKSSSWVNLVEDNKRRVWQWCVSIFLFVILSSVILLIMLRSIDPTRYLLDFGSKAQDMIMRDARRYCEFVMGLSAFKIVLSTLTAALFAYGGFSYLNDKVKLDFYESMPEKRGNRFSTIWLNGIIMFAGPYIIGTLLCLAVASVCGYGGLFTMEEALFAFCKVFLYFLGVYHLSIFAIMLTGTTFAGVCAFLILSVYEYMCRGLILQLKNSFFTYDRFLPGSIVPRLSPYGLIMLIMSENGGDEIKYIAGLIAFDLILLAITYYLFVLRAREMAGKTLAFKHISTPVKLLACIPVVAYTAVIVTEVLNRSRELTNSDMLLISFVSVIGSILSCALMQAVFELDIKGAVNKKFHWILCALLGLCIFFGFKFDVLGLDRHLPAVSRVESCVFAPSGYDDSYPNMDENLRSIDGDAFWLKYMYLYDTESVYELTKLSMKKCDEAMAISGDKYSLGEDFSNATVFFRLKGGRLVAKELMIPVRDKEACELLDRIMSTSEFVKGYYGVEVYDTDKAVDSTEILDLDARYTDGVHETRLSPDELKELLRLYKSDMESFSYKSRLDILPSGFVNFNINTDDSGYFYQGRGGYYQSLTIYPDMKGCVDYLKEKGFDHSDISLADEALRITVTDYHYDEQQEKAEELGLNYLPEDMSADFVKECEYDRERDADDFEKIAAVLYPNEHGVYRWDGGLGLEYDKEVHVYFAEGSKAAAGFRNGAYYCFIKDQVPDFVRKATALD